MSRCDKSTYEFVQRYKEYNVQSYNEKRVRTLRFEGDVLVVCSAHYHTTGGGST
jgi:hypothetical protein